MIHAGDIAALLHHGHEALQLPINGGGVAHQLELVHAADERQVGEHFAQLFRTVIRADSRG